MSPALTEAVGTTELLSGVPGQAGTPHGLENALHMIQCQQCDEHLTSHRRQVLERGKLHAAVWNGGLLWRIAVLDLLWARARRESPPPLNRPP